MPHEHDPMLNDAALKLRQAVAPHLPGKRLDLGALHAITAALLSAPREVGVLLYRPATELVYLNSGSLLPTAVIRGADPSVQHTAARVASAQGGITLSPQWLETVTHLEDGPLWTWVISMGENDPVLSADAAGRPCVWVPLALTPEKIRGLVEAARDSDAIVPIVEAHSWPEELSLGEPIPASVDPCDVPPDVVLRTRDDHRNLLRGDLTPLQPEERIASIRQFPDPRSMEPVGFSRRGQRWIAITDDGRGYIWEKSLPSDTLVVSLSPEVAGAFAPLLTALPPNDRAWRNRLLDRALRAPSVDVEEIDGAPSRDVKQKARAALDALQREETYRAAWADRSVWSWLCANPGQARELRPVWEMGDYAALLARVGRDRGAVADLVRSAAALRGTRAALAVQVGADRHRVGLPTSMLDNLAGLYRGSEHDEWLAATRAAGQVQARQTIMILSAPDYRRLRNLILASVSEWQELAQGSTEDKRTFQGWIDRARALPDIDMPHTAKPSAPKWGPATGQLTQHQRHLVTALAERTERVPALADFEVDVAWREEGTGRTIVRLAAMQPPRVLAFVLPPEAGDPAPLPVKAQPGSGDKILSLDFLDRSSRKPASPAKRSVERCLSRVEKMLTSGAPAGSDPSRYAFSHGLTRTPIGSRPNDAANPVWQDALVRAQVWLRVAYPDLSIIRSEKDGDACGAFACAYRTARLPGYVVKITGDATDAAAWGHAGDGIPGLARTLYVAHVPVETIDDSPPVFVIVQEEVAGLSQWERRFLDARRSSHRFGLENGLGNEAMWREAVRAYTDRSPSKWGTGTERRLESNVLRLRRALAALRRRGVRLHDLHGGNTRRRADGAWVITDMGLSSCGTVDIPTASHGDLRALAAQVARQASYVSSSTTSGTVERMSTRPQIPAELATLLPDLVRLAQKQYDAWQQDEEGWDEEVGGGGICHLIADEFVGRLNAAGYTCTTVSSTHEVHVYTVVRLPSGVWLVDIRPHVYETGGGYTWTKIPDVVFDVSDVTVSRLSSDPRHFRDFIDADSDWEEEDEPEDEQDEDGENDEE